MARSAGQPKKGKGAKSSKRAAKAPAAPPDYAAAALGAISVARGIIEQCSAEIISRLMRPLEDLVLLARKRLNGGRPSKDVDFGRVRQLASKGLWKVSAIARLIGVSPSTALSGVHADAIKEAIEDGKAAFEEQALDQYQNAIQDGCHPAIVSALIFKMKQLGWSDRVQATGGSSYEQDIPGARERLRELVLRYRKAKGITS